MKKTIALTLILSFILLLPVEAFAAIDVTLGFTQSTRGTGTSCAVNKPAGVVDGDFMLATLYTEGNPVVTEPTGWTLIVNYDDPNTTGDLYVYYKRASGEGASYSWTFASNYQHCWIKRFTGVVASGDPEDATRTTKSGTSAANPSWDAITTATAGSAVMGIANSFTGTGQSWSASTLTERIDATDLFLQGDIQAAAGSSGALGVTDAVSDSWNTILIALKAEPAAITANSPTVSINGQVNLDGQMSI